jgi:hypothetical protein
MSTHLYLHGMYMLNDEIFILTLFYIWGECSSFTFIQIDNFVKPLYHYSAWNIF